MQRLIARLYSAIDWTTQALYTRHAIRFQETWQTSSRSQAEIDQFYDEKGLVVEGQERPKPMLTFQEWGTQDFSGILTRKGWKKPTPVQSTAWPIAIRGRDLVACVRTGSGKTLGFVLPALLHIQAQAVQRTHEGPTVLVLSPTRELAFQTSKCFEEFGQPHFVKTALLTGGTSRKDQVSEVQKGVHVYTATPGRLLDLLSNGFVNLRRMTFLVVDEADKMMEMGFESELQGIMSHVRPDRQTSMWTATMSASARSFAGQFLRDPIFITEQRESMSANPNIHHDVRVVSHEQKFKVLLDILDSKEKTIVFLNSQDACHALEHSLRDLGYHVTMLHGGMPNSDRLRSLQNFHEDKFDIVVATDLASRGLDFKRVHTVVNYEVPRTLEDYVHRCGRTGRMELHGTAVTFFTASDLRMARPLIRHIRKTQREVAQALVDLARHR